MEGTDLVCMISGLNFNLNVADRVCMNYDLNLFMNSCISRNSAGRRAALRLAQGEILVRFFIGTYLGNGTYIDDVRVLAWC